MASWKLFRIGGAALTVGAASFIVYLIARSAITAGADPVLLYQESLWVPINALGVLSAVLVLLGLPAMYVRIAEPTGMLGLVGVILVALAWMFFGLFLSLYSVLVAPWLAEQAPALVASSAPLPEGFVVVFAVGLMAELIGTTLLAIPFLRGAAAPRWVGYALPAALLLTLCGDLVAPTGPATNLAINLLSNLGLMVLMVALGTLGARLWLEKYPAAGYGQATTHLSPG